MKVFACESRWTFLLWIRKPAKLRTRKSTGRRGTREDGSITLKVLVSIWFPSYNSRVIHRVIALQLSCALIAFSFGAPCLHIHTAWDSDHVRQNHYGLGSRLHTHAAHLSHTQSSNHGSATELRCDQDGDDAVFLNWVPDNPGSGSIVSIPLAQIDFLVVPEQKSDWAQAPVRPSHDPPAIPASPPRAPPYHSLPLS